MRCPKCGSTNVVSNSVSVAKTERRGCLSWTLWILLALCTFGLILIIPIITNNRVVSKVKVVHVCQDCGNSWY